METTITLLKGGQAGDDYRYHLLTGRTRPQAFIRAWQEARARRTSGRPFHFTRRARS